MTSKVLRRRLHNGDVDGRSHEHLETTEFDGLNEPLLGDYKSENGNPEGHTAGDLWDNEERKVGFHWAFLFSQLIAQWAQCIASLVIGPASLIGRLLSLTSDAQSGHGNRLLRCSLSPLQEERLRYLKRRLEVPYNGSCLQHQDALKRLWRLAFPDRELPSLKSELWKEMGWQGTDPSTDFRGGGFISLENLIFFAQQYADSFHRLLHKKDGTRAEWEYPFAVAGVNISFMLAQMLDLQSGNLNSSIGIRFLELLEKDEKAFDKLYCVAFKMIDAQWLAKRASYMDFNEVLKSTRTQLERELALEDVSSVMDLPAYNLL